jgi:hypothetical protein
MRGGASRRLPRSELRECDAVADGPARAMVISGDGESRSASRQSGPCHAFSLGRDNLGGAA